MKHKFHTKDPITGDWLVFCPDNRMSFTTALWDIGFCQYHSCPYCNRGVNEDFTPKLTEYQKREIKRYDNGKRFNISIYYEYIHKSLSKGQKKLNDFKEFKEVIN